MSIERKTIAFDPARGTVSETKESLSWQHESERADKVEWSVLSVSPAWEYQKIEGFGCALTGTSCALLSKLPPRERKAALRCWFGEGGINARYIRLSLDSCDYSPFEYQAVADPMADPSLSTFSIDTDRKLIFPVLREALALAAPDCEVLLSPWSPPYQWKTPPEGAANDAAAYGNQAAETGGQKPGRCRGGRLKREYYGAWARYIVRYVAAYLEEGIPVTMLTIQNEPDAATPWDSCLWSGEEEARFLTESLYPALRESGLSDKIGIFFWDHNKERMAERALEVLRPSALPLVRGMAYHWYTGDHFEALQMVHEKFPGLVLMHSESCPLHIPYRTHEKGRKALTLSQLQQDYQDACRYAHDLLGDLNHGMNRWIDWNLMVDRDGGPRHVPGGFASPLVYEDDGTWTKTLIYRYLHLMLAHLPRNAVRLGSSCYTDKVEYCAARRAEGGVVVLLFNKSEETVPLLLRMDGIVADITAAPHTLSAIDIHP